MHVSLGRTKLNRRIGFVTLPAKNERRIDLELFLMYTQNDCTRECECKCVGKKW